MKRKGGDGGRRATVFDKKDAGRRTSEGMEMEDLCSKLTSLVPQEYYLDTASQAARDLWSSLGMLHLVEETAHENRSGSVLLETLLRSQNCTMQGLDNVGLKETVAITCWYLWWLRRRRTHNEAVPPINRCKMSILTMAANQANSFKPERASSEIKWTRPEPRHLKLNVDASFYADSCSGATGAVLRDYQGQFVAASTRFLPNMASIAMAEAVAMKEGLALASRLGCNAIIAESDSTDTIEACTESNTWWNGSAAIFADIVDLASTIDSVQYRYVPREANMTAHEIARQGFIDKINCNWDDDPPSFLLSFLIHDVTTGD